MKAEKRKFEVESSDQADTTWPRSPICAQRNCHNPMMTTGLTPQYHQASSVGGVDPTLSAPSRSARS